MPNKFLRNPLRPGEPISRAQIADAIDKMDKAWGTLDCLGGEVAWHNGRPTIIPNGSSGELVGGFDVRGERGLFKAVTDRAYLIADDELVPPETEFDSDTMYLYPTWDCIRWPAPEGS
jgi:hypothetical protein